MLVAPNTPFLEKIFKDDGAVLYESSKDLVDKVKYYLNNDMERQRISENGYNYVKKGKFEAKDRVNQIIKDYKKNRIKAQK